MRPPIALAPVRYLIVVAYRYMSAKDVAAVFGVDHQTVINYVRAAGEPVRWKHYNGGAMTREKAA